MTEQELMDRREKKAAQIGKIEKRIAKWTADMNDEAKALAAACEVTSDNQSAFKDANIARRAYSSQHADDPTVYNQDDYNKGPNIQEAASAYIDLAGAKAQLAKYDDQLKKVRAFQSEEKVPVIWEFLQNWRKSAYEFFVDNIAEYARLNAGYQAAYERFKASDEYQSITGRREQYIRYRQWENEYYGNIHSITKTVYQYNGKWDDARLNKILDAEVEAKYKDFIKRISEKAGDIVDASGLRIGYNGSINGVVVGSKAKVRVETILAGGYNIQCLHYRVLVNAIK